MNYVNINPIIEFYESKLHEGINGVNIQKKGQKKK